MIYYWNFYTRETKKKESIDKYNPGFCLKFSEEWYFFFVTKKDANFCQISNWLFYN